MFGTYLRRELAGRRKQTMIVTAGLAMAVALVIVGNALTTGVRDTQQQALQSLYGVGTDLTVTGAAQQPGQRTGQRFSFAPGGAASGAAGAQGSATSGADGTTLNSSRLMLAPGRSTIPASDVATIARTSGVAAASASLRLDSIDFSGQLKAPAAGSQSDASTPQRSPDGASSATGDTAGGTRGFGGGAFNLDATSVLGVDGNAGSVGPLSSVTVDVGRALAKTDAGTAVAVIDATYATSSKLTLGDSISLGGTPFTIVGIVSSTQSSTADTAADAYIPLDEAQRLSSAGDVVSTVYVQAGSAASLSNVQSALEQRLPTATVSSQSQLAATVSGSLSSASSLIASLGLWLSVILLIAAVLVAVLFTLSGVSRRTRELGTLKAIGWSNGRVVRQIAGESVVQGLIGGVAGAVLGIGIALVLNLLQPTVPLSAAQAAGFAPGGGLGGAGVTAHRITELTLHAPLSAWIILLAIGLAVLGGLIAGGFGGWRAARLRPAEALRSVG